MANKNTGMLFRNENKRDNQPDYVGTVCVGETEYSIAAWVKQTKKNEDFFSLSLSPKSPTADSTEKPWGGLFKQNERSIYNAELSGTIFIENREFDIVAATDTKGLVLEVIDLPRTRINGRWYPVRQAYATKYSPGADYSFEDETLGGLWQVC